MPKLCPINTFNKVENGTCLSCPSGGVTFEKGSIECIIVKVDLPFSPSEMVFMIQNKPISIESETKKDIGGSVDDIVKETIQAKEKTMQQIMKNLDKGMIKHLLKFLRSSIHDRNQFWLT